MRNLAGLLRTLLALSCFQAAAEAASITTVAYPSNVRAFYLDGASLNGAFDTIYFKATPNGGAAFTNNYSGLLSGTPRPAGQAFTYHNRMLNADPLDFEGGLGLSMFGLVNTPQELSFTVAKLGGTMTTADQPSGKLFLGNVTLTRAGASANALVQLLRAGTLVYEAQIVPEPTGLALICLGGCACFFSRRRHTG